MSRIARLGFYSLAVILLAGSVPAAAQTTGWSSPSRLGLGNLNFTYANNVSLASSGHALAQAVAVWTDTASQTIFYAVRRNGAWSGARPVYRAPVNAIEELTDAQVVIDSTGTATALWGSVRQGQMMYCYNGRFVYRCPELIAYARTSTLAPGATGWSRPANVSPKGAYVSAVQAGIDGSGQIVASWVLRATRTSDFTLQAARKAGTWTPATALRAAPAISASRLAVGHSGDAVVTWAENQASPSPAATVNASFYSAASGAWSSPEAVGSQPTPIGYLRAAVDGTGRATVLWNDAAAILWSEREAGAWTSAAVLFADGVAGPEIAADASGRRVMTWLHVGGAPDGSNTVEARVIDPLGAATDLVWASGAGTSPSVAMAGDGGAVVSWVDEVESNTYAATLAPDGAWTGPVLLSTGATQYTSVWGTTVVVAAGPGTQAYAAWLGGIGTNGQFQILAAARP